jgi:hypothetical protein
MTIERSLKDTNVSGLERMIAAGLEGRTRVTKKAVEFSANRER